MRRIVRENGLSIFFLGIFLLAVGFQTLAGWQDFNNDQLRHGGEAITFGRFLVSSEFGQALLENWQSEYLQFTLYILATVWLVQRGSPESKPLDQAGGDSDKSGRTRGFGAWVYSNSLVLVMVTIWLASWAGQSITGHSAYNADLLEHHQTPLSYGQYLGTADFWESTLQNWQSEFLAVGSMAILAVYLRQRGSPESKPVGAAHDATGSG
jgi:hypothetical protein